MARTLDPDERAFARLLTKSASVSARHLGAAVLEVAVPDVEKVGPGGWEHGWHFVGVPSIGDVIHHPKHGRGTVSRVDEHGHVHVRYDSGKRRRYEAKPGTAPARLVARDTTTDHVTLGGNAARAGRHGEAAWHYRRAAGEHPAFAAELLGRADTAEAKVPAPDFTKATDGELDRLFHDLSTQDHPNETHLQAMLAEMDRRDEHDRAARQIQDRIDALVARGRSPAQAHAEVHGLDEEELGRQERAALVDASRRAGETREDTARRLYREHVHQQLVHAEQATRGHLLSPEGRAKGVDPVTLFSGPAARARKFGSEDLHRHWAAHPRQSYREFRSSLLGRKGDREAAAAARFRGNGRDFGV